MEHLTGTNSLDSQEEFVSDHLKITKLIFGNAHNDHPDSQVSEILLKRKLAIDGHEYVELFLSGLQKSPVLERTPALVVNGSRLMIQEKSLDPWIYALVNKDAHSRI